jgi:hypothetical protein
VFPYHNSRSVLSFSHKERSNRGRQGQRGYAWKYDPPTRRKDVRFLRNKLTGEEYETSYFDLFNASGLPYDAFKALQALDMDMGPLKLRKALVSWEFVYHNSYSEGSWRLHRTTPAYAPYRPGLMVRNANRVFKKRARREGRQEIETVLADQREEAAFKAAWSTMNRACLLPRCKLNQAGRAYENWLLSQTCEDVEALRAHYGQDYWYGSDWYDDFEHDSYPEYWHDDHDLYDQYDYWNPAPQSQRWLELYMVGTVNPDEDRDSGTWWYEDYESEGDYESEDWSLRDFLNGKKLPEDARIHADEDHRNDKLKAGERYFRQHKRSTFKPMIAHDSESPYCAINRKAA